MIILNARATDNAALNASVRAAKEDCEITGCIGERFIGAGLSDKTIKIKGIPGNALGAYLDGAKIIVDGNAQDAVGDTMNDGEIIVRGNAGDAAGYAMRGGKIYIKGNAGYRAGIHMKEYRGKVPVIVIGGRCGSFLGEYQAGGIIIVLGLHADGKRVTGNFPCAGMHGGKVLIRGNADGVIFDDKVTARKATADDLSDATKYIAEFCSLFGYDEKEILSSPFTVVTPDSANPYKRMYIEN